MSWKNIKTHYRIGHMVQINEKGICIGSPYIHDLIVIGLDGKIIKRDDGRVNEDLARYMREFDADPAKLAEVVKAPDVFERSLPVWTYDGGEVIEKFCEQYDWPNVTHDGCMMYENTFFQDKAKAIKKAIANAEYGIKWESERLAELKEEYERKSGNIAKQLAESKANLEKLNRDYPF